MDTQRRRRTEEPPLDERAQDHVRDDVTEGPSGRRPHLDGWDDEDDDDESLRAPSPARTLSPRSTDSRTPRPAQLLPGRPWHVYGTLC
jgi:hypothetical protein